MEVEALEFKLQGKMAHFRKYYSNSTALSYHVPPVVTIKGMLAGILGYKRDAYYADFADSQCRIAIAVDAPLRKITQTMNLLKVEKPGDFQKLQYHTQNDTEWVIPQNIRTDVLSYTIVVVHQNAGILNRLTEKICTLPLGYFSDGIALALGSAQCQGWISGGRRIQLSRRVSDGEAVPSRFAVPVSVITSAKPYQQSFSLKKEETILEFDENRYITPGSKQDILISANGKPILYTWCAKTVYWGYEEEYLILLGDNRNDLGAL